MNWCRWSRLQFNLYLLYECTQLLTNMEWGNSSLWQRAATVRVINADLITYLQSLLNGARKSKNSPVLSTGKQCIAGSVLLYQQS